MSATTDPLSRESGDRDSWEKLADHQEALEICIEEDTPFADDARGLLEELSERGYR